MFCNTNPLFDCVLWVLPNIYKLANAKVWVLKRNIDKTAEIEFRDD